jgi:transcriptional regulator with XRE-family HTH domain
MANAFLTRLRAAVREKNCSQSDIARAVGTSNGTVSHWFSGRSQPGGVLLPALAEYLGVRAQWLASGVGPKHLSSTESDAPKKLEAGEVERQTMMQNVTWPMVMATRQKHLDALSLDLAKLFEVDRTDFSVEETTLIGRAMVEAKLELQEWLNMYRALPANERREAFEFMRAKAAPYLDVSRETLKPMAELIDASGKETNGVIRKAKAKDKRSSS